MASIQTPKNCASTFTPHVSNKILVCTGVHLFHCPHLLLSLRDSVARLSDFSFQEEDCQRATDYSILHPFSRKFV